MPKAKESSNHPCHFLSLPSAKRFWCRHCMSVFEDAITRWRHSRNCRYGVVNNFMRRRQLEAKALQNTTKPNPIEARLEQSVSPSEEPIVDETMQASTSSGETSNQATCNDLFRCFICHNKFSTLEEMRHHVKYPCNNKKIVTDVPNPAMTVYIDEFTDRSRQWEPQPLQEEVVSSEFVPNIISQETVQSTVDVKDVITQDNTIPLQTQNKPSNITPTNIYVNEQGETVIEVENLDLNSEGGELSLAHLLTQLSQQGIVFDKNKASQMQAHHETAVSDSASGEVYATGQTSFDHSTSTQTVIREDDEGQSTAEDAANTLAQLAIFRGYRANPEAYEGAQMSEDVKREYVVERSSEGYCEHFPLPSSSSGNTITVGTTESHPSYKVHYEYDYLPSTQSTTDVSTVHPQISIQSGILDPTPSQLSHIEVSKEHGIRTVQSVSATMQVQPGIQPQVMTYLTPSTSSAQQTQTSEGEQTMLIQDFVVEDPDSTTASAQHYHVNISDGVIRHSESQQTAIPTVLEAGQNSYIVFDAEDNSTQIICNPQDNRTALTVSHHHENELTAGNNTVSNSILHNDTVSSDIQQGHYIHASNNIRENANEIKDSEEFEVQTVTLQEIAENESTNNVTIVQNHPVLCSEQMEGHAEVSIVNNNNDNNTIPLNQSENHSIQLDLLHHQPTANSIHPDGFTVAVEQQQQPSQQDGESSSVSSVPVYVVGPNGGLQLVTPSQDGLHVQPQEHIIIPSNKSQP